MPELTVQKVQDDVMSESESDDEGEDDVLIPTVDMCKGFFEQIAEQKLAARLEAAEEDPKGKGGKNAAKFGGVGSVKGSDKQFARQKVSRVLQH